MIDFLIGFGICAVVLLTIFKIKKNKEKYKYRISTSEPVLPPGYNSTVGPRPLYSTVALFRCTNQTGLLPRRTGKYGTEETDPVSEVVYRNGTCELNQKKIT
jgi:hypothetical protein